MALAYYRHLRFCVSEHPELRNSLCRCRHCGIWFPTYPSCAGRKDLRCPFGCQEAHQKAQSAARSAAYYNTPEGKRRNSEHNQRYRDAQKLATETGTLEAPRQVEDEEQTGGITFSWAALARQCQCSTGLLYYFSMLIAVLSGDASRAKTVALDLVQEKSQRGLCSESRIDYTLRYLYENPP